MAAQFVPLLEKIRSAANSVAEPSGTAAVIEPMKESVPGLKMEASPCAEAKVEVIRDEGRVVQIRVHCKCGEVIHLACDY